MGCGILTPGLESTQLEGKLGGRWASMLAGYGLALLVVGMALLATLFVQRLFVHPFLFLFFAAVVVSAWMGGAGPGLFAVLISTLGVDYYFLPPIHSFAVKPPDVAYFSAFVLSALAGTWVSSSQRESRVALVAAHNELEIHVAERTAASNRRTRICVNAIASSV